MFQFLFKYPSPVFTKGRFVLLSPWPAWLLLVLIIVCGRRAGVAGTTEAEGRRAHAAKLARVGGVGDAVGVRCAVVAAAVATGDDGCGAEFAAEHYCGGGG